MAFRWISKPKKRRRKPEFSKLWLIAVFSATVAFISASYVLAWFGRNPVEGLSSTIAGALLTTDAISFFGYNLQNIGRAFSRRKENENDGSTK